MKVQWQVTRTSFSAGSRIGGSEDFWLIFTPVGVTMNVTIRRVPRLFDLHAVLGAMFCCFFQFQGSNS